MGAERSHADQGFENFPIGKFFRERLTRRSASLRDMTLCVIVGRSPLCFNHLFAQTLVLVERPRPCLAHSYSVHIDQAHSLFSYDWVYIQYSSFPCLNVPACARLTCGSVVAYRVNQRHIDGP